MNAISIELAAYFSGVLDGEGHISVHRSKNGSQDVRVQVVNTGVAWLRDLQREVGCGAIRGPYANGVGAKPLARLDFRRAEIRWLLPQCLPYLRLKRRQAEQVLRYFDVVDVIRRSLKTDPVLPIKRAELEGILTEMATINQKGTLGKVRKQHTMAFKKCSIVACERPHRAKGFCRQHYRRYIEYGGRAWYERTCQRCEKPFVAKRKSNVFCSPHCNHMAWIQANKDDQNAKRRIRRHAQAS